MSITNNNDVHGKDDVERKTIACIVVHVSFKADERSKDEHVLYDNSKYIICIGEDVKNPLLDQ